MQQHGVREFNLRYQDKHPHADDGCPVCEKHMRIEFVKQDEMGRDLNESYASEANDDNQAGLDCAYIAFMWEPDGDHRQRTSSDYERLKQNAQKNVVDALLLGYSLYKHCRVQKRILMTTAQALKVPGAQLLNLFWKIVETDHVHCAPSWVNGCEGRFKSTFAKLRAMELDEFRQIVVLDLDLLVLKSIDELFLFRTPAALCRGNLERPPGDCRPGGTYFRGANGRLHGGINAGVIVLQPSKWEFARMLRELATDHGQMSTCPEQDFLTKWYDGKWFELPVKYNFQLHQLGHLSRHPGLDLERRLPFDEILVFHFSGRAAPHDFLFEDTYKNFEDFLRDGLIPKYGDLMEYDRPTAVKAANLWYQNWFGAWCHIIQTVHSKFLEKLRDIVCRACHRTDRDIEAVEHTFFECSKIAALRAEWDHYRPPGCGLREALQYPSIVPRPLLFMESVYLLRFPEEDRKPEEA